MSSFAIQTVLMLITSALISSGIAADGPQHNRDPEIAGNRGYFDWVELCPIALLAFQSAGQIVASRVLKYNSMPTLVLTSLYCDLFSDPNLLTAGLFEDPDRNRRAASATTLFVGAVVGGALSKSSWGFRWPCGPPPGSRLVRSSLGCCGSDKERTSIEIEIVFSLVS